MSYRILLENFLLDPSSLPPSSISSLKTFRLTINEKTFSSSWKKSLNASLLLWEEQFTWSFQTKPTGTESEQSKITCEVLTKGLLSPKLLFKGTITLSGPNIQSVVDNAPLVIVELTSMASSKNVFSASPVLFKFSWACEVVVPTPPATPKVRGSPEKIMEIQRMAANMVLQTTESYESDGEGNETGSGEESDSGHVPPPPTPSPGSSLLERRKSIHSLLSITSLDTNAALQMPMTPHSVDIDSESGDEASLTTDSSDNNKGDKGKEIVEDVPKVEIEQVSIDDFYVAKENPVMNSEIKKSDSTPAKSPTNPILNKFKAGSNPLLLRASRSQKSTTPTNKKVSIDVSADQPDDSNGNKQLFPLTPSVKPPMHPNTPITSAPPVQSLPAPCIPGKLLEDPSDTASIISEESVHPFSADELNTPMSQHKSVFFPPDDNQEALAFYSADMSDMSDDEDTYRRNGNGIGDVVVIKNSDMMDSDAMRPTNSVYDAHHSSNSLFPCLDGEDLDVDRTKPLVKANPFFSAVSDSESDVEPTAGDNECTTMPPKPISPKPGEHLSPDIALSSEAKYTPQGSTLSLSLSVSPTYTSSAPSLTPTTSSNNNQRIVSDAISSLSTSLTYPHRIELSSQAESMGIMSRRMSAPSYPPPPPPPLSTLKDNSDSESDEVTHSRSANTTSLSIKALGDSPSLHDHSPPSSGTPPTNFALPTSTKESEADGVENIDEVSEDRSISTPNSRSSSVSSSRFRSNSRPNSRSALVSLFDHIEATTEQESFNLLEGAYDAIELPNDPPILVTSIKSDSSALVREDSMLKSANANYNVNKELETKSSARSSLLESINRRRSISLSRPTAEPNDRSPSSLLGAIKNLTTVAMVEAEERKLQIIPVEEKEESIALTETIALNPRQSQTNDTANTSKQLLDLSIAASSENVDADEIVSKVPFSPKFHTIIEEPEPLIVKEETTRRGSNKIQELQANAESLLKKTLADKEKGIDVLTAVRRSSMIKTADLSDVPLSITIPDGSSRSSPFSDPPTLPSRSPRLIRLSSTRKMSAGSNNFMGSAFDNFVTEDVPQKRNKSDASTMEMLGDSNTNNSNNTGVKKRSAIYGMSRSSVNLARESPVFSLWNKDLSSNAMSSEDLNGLLATGSKDDDSVSVSAYSVTGSSVLGSFTPVPHSTKPPRRPSSLDRKMSRSDILQAIERERGSMTPLIPPGPGSVTKAVNEEENKLAQTVLNFTSTIKRTMSQANIKALDSASKEISPQKADAQVGIESLGDALKSPPRVAFPDLEAFPGDCDDDDDDDDENVVVESKASVDQEEEAFPRLKNPFIRRTTVSNNEVVGAVTGKELGSFHTFQAVNNLFPKIGSFEIEESILKSNALDDKELTPIAADANKLFSDYFRTLGDAIRPGVLRIYRLIELGMQPNNYNNTSSASTAPAAPMTLPHTPIPKRRSSLTMNANNTNNIVGQDNTLKTSQAAKRSSSTSPLPYNDAVSVASKSPSLASAKSTVPQHSQHISTSVLHLVSVVPVKDFYDTSNLFDIIMQKHNMHFPDIFHMVKAKLAMSLVYEQADDIFYAAEYLQDIYRAHISPLDSSTNHVMQVQHIDIHEIYRFTRILLLAFTAEEHFIASLKAMKEEIYAALQQEILRSTFDANHIDQIASRRSTTPNGAPTLLASAAALKTEAASISAQMMVYVIPANLALIEFLCKLSTVKEAVRLHTTHYKAMYKNKVKDNELFSSPSRLLNSTTSQSHSRFGTPSHLSLGSYGREDYKFLKAFIKVIDLQLNHAVALVDPILAQQNQNGSVAQQITSLTQRIHDAIRGLYQDQEISSGVSSLNWSRTVTGISLVNKVQLLLRKCEDLTNRMQIYQEQYMNATHQSSGHYRANALEDDKLRRTLYQHNQSLLQDSEYFTSDSDEDESGEGKGMGSKMKNKGNLEGGVIQESLLIPLQDLLKQKEEIKKRIGSFHHTYLEEINDLIKQCLQSPPTHHSNTPPATPETGHQQGSLVTVNSKVFILNNGLDTLCNRIWEQTLRSNEMPFVSLLIKSQCTAMLKSIYQHWPGLTVRIPIDPTPSVPSTPDYLQKKSFKRSMSNFSLRGGLENTSVNSMPFSPPKSAQQPFFPLPPQINTIEYEIKYTRDIDVDQVNFNQPKTLRAIGFTLTQLWDSHCYSWPQLLSAGYPLSYFKQLRDATNLAPSGLNGSQMAGMGFGSDGQEVNPLQGNLTVLELRKAGYSIAQCRAAGFDVPSLLAGGFSELEIVNSQVFSILELKRAGCDIQRLALKELFELTNGKHWRNKERWCSPDPIKEWFGVNVDGRGMVVKIDLRGNALVGALPISICLLTGLEYLDLSGNRLSGLLPEDKWSHFTHLKDLWLDRNDFSPQEARLNKAMLNKVLPHCRVRI